MNLPVEPTLCWVVMIGLFAEGGYQMNLKQLLELVVTLLALFSSIYAFMKFIDFRVERRLKDESFLRKLASFLRPTAIFDQSGAILVDQGAMDFLQEISVDLTSGSPLPTAITLYPKKYLAHPPLITTLENEFLTAIPSRGPKFQFNYKLHYDDWAGGIEKRRFRVEILL